MYPCMTGATDLGVEREATVMWYLVVIPPDDDHPRLSVFIERDSVQAARQAIAEYPRFNRPDAETAGHVYLVGDSREVIEAAMKKPRLPRTALTRDNVLLTRNAVENSIEEQQVAPKSVE